MRFSGCPIGTTPSFALQIFVRISGTLCIEDCHLEEWHTVIDMQLTAFTVSALVWLQRGLASISHAQMACSCTSFTVSALVWVSQSNNTFCTAKQSLCLRFSALVWVSQSNSTFCTAKQSLCLRFSGCPIGTTPSFALQTFVQVSGTLCAEDCHLKEWHSVIDMQLHCIHCVCTCLDVPMEQHVLHRKTVAVFALFWVSRLDDSQFCTANLCASFWNSLHRRLPP